MIKRSVFLVLLLLSFFLMMGGVSAASNSSLTLEEVENSSYAAQSFTESVGDIPYYVKVSNKTVSDEAFLEVLCKAVVNVNSGVQTSVTVNGRGTAPGPSGTASGTLTKSQYLTVANNIKSFYTSNGRAPNYAESALGNIRYETLVYMYSKIMNYYRLNNQLPSSISFSHVSGVSSHGIVVDVTPPTVSNNLAGGTYNSSRNVTLTASDNVDANPWVYYSINNGAWISQIKTVSLSLNQGRTDLRYYAGDASGNVGATQVVTYYIDTTAPTVTVSPSGGVYNGTVTVNLSASDNLDSNPVIYYTLDDGVSWLNQTKTIIFDLNMGVTRLQLYARDMAGNTAVIQSVNYMIGSTAPPSVTCSLAGGNYTDYQNVTLKVVDDFEYSPLVFYSLNNGTNWYNQTNNVTLALYSGRWDLLYYGMDSEGNCGLVQNVSYFIDTSAPVVWANLTTGLYNSSQLVNLTVSDNLDTDPRVYYTLNGLDPTITSAIYVEPLDIANTTTLKFMAMDNLGNHGDIITEHYIFAPIGNLNTGKGYSRIQDAIDDSLTLDGHVIEVAAGTYTENIVVNKKIALISLANGTTIQSENPSNSVISIFSGGTGSLIRGFNIRGSTGDCGIYMEYAGNCKLIDNNISNNSYGIFLYNSPENLISENNITGNSNGIHLSKYSNGNKISENRVYNNSCNGIRIIAHSNYEELSEEEIIINNIPEYYITPSSTIISGNSITSNYNGIFIDDYSSSNTIYQNLISDNIFCGISVGYSGADIHFNSITGNGYGLYVYSGFPVLINATNNWWGSNNVSYINSLNPPASCDIWDSNGMVDYSPYLVLTVTPTSYKVSNGRVYESTITADLTSNSDGADTSSQGHVPDDLEVFFIAQYGSISNSQSTRKGKASSTLVLNPLIQSVTGVLALFDDEFSYTWVDNVANAVISVGGTARDLSTNQSVDFTYEIPLNESTAWVSVLWKETGLFHGEIDLIVNGNVVASKNVVNEAYLAYHNSYSQNVFEQIRYINYLFLNPVESTSFVPNQYLQPIITANHLENLTLSQLEDFILFVVQDQNNFTDNEINFIKNNRRYFVDLVGVQMFYPGDAVKTISFVDPDNNETLSLNCPGNPIFRVSPMVYFDGYSADANGTMYDVGYEGVRSFAIATTEVTDSVVQYWLSKKSLFAPGAMKAAYGTFLTSLLVIKCHDMVADQAAEQFNVTWCRTTPVVVSCLDDAASSYITGEMDHRMGMDVTGTVSNVWAFRYACSLSFSPIENMVGSPGSVGSVTMGIGERFLDGDFPEIFVSKGYWVLKIRDKDDLILVLDPETGIVRDIATGICGVYCYHNQITDRQISLAENLSCGNPALQPVWLNSTAEICMISGVGYASMSEFSFSAGALPEVSVSTVFAELGVTVEAVPPVAVALSGVFVACAIFDYCVDQGWLPPERCREILGTVSPLFAIINMYYYDEKTPTIEALEEAYWKASIFYTIIGQKEHNERNVQWYQQQIRELQKIANILNGIGKPSDDDYDEAGKVIDALAKDAGKRIVRGISKYQAGDVTGGTVEIVIAFTEIHTAFTIKTAFP